MRHAHPTEILARTASERSRPITPRISIGLPVYNGEEFLAPCIETLLAQTCGDFELIVADNASTDGSLAIARSFRDPRIRVVPSARNRGAAWNFNRCVGLARAPLFKWAACDDLLEPDFLAACLDALEHCPEAVLAYTHVTVLDRRGRPRGPYRKRPQLDVPSPARRLLEITWWMHACLMVFGLIRVEALRQTSLIGPYFASDRVLLAHLALLGRMVEVPRALFGWRRHPGQSINLYLRPAAVARWFDSAARGRAYFPRWRMGREYLRLLSRVPLSPAERRACHRVLAGWALWKAPFLGFDLVRGLVVGALPGGDR